MITILTTTKDQDSIRKVVDSVDRLNELVAITTENSSSIPGDKVITVLSESIECAIDWFDTEPPILLPVVPFDNESLLAIVFYKLGNEQQAFEYLQEDNPLFVPLLIATQIKFGYQIEMDALEHLSAHNRAIVHHYGILSLQSSLDDLEARYKDVLSKESNSSLKCFTAKHYANLLLDVQRYDEAAELCATCSNETKQEEALIALRILWTTAKTKGLQLPYNEKELLKIAEDQAKCIAYLLEHEFQLQAALLALDASDVSNYLGNYPTAKEYLTLAIKIFKEHQIPEFMGEAALKKATLLYNWSKNGSPQYYKASINAFQDALKIFKRDTHPEQFAEIHHNLALIYSEIPAAPEEKGMWIAFSASAFKEALQYFSEEQFPYEYAMVCHNYATALMDFPPAKLHNNHEKANDFFEKALAIRTAEAYPTERAISLLNVIELGWLMHNDNEKIEEQRLLQMKKQAEEVLTLVKDTHLQQKAQEQLARLEELKTLI